MQVDGLIETQVAVKTVRLKSKAADVSQFVDEVRVMYWQMLLETCDQCANSQLNLALFAVFGVPKTTSGLFAART
jgi:hypothetical protein